MVSIESWKYGHSNTRKIDFGNPWPYDSTPSYSFDVGSGSINYVDLQISLTTYDINTLKIDTDKNILSIMLKKDKKI